MTFFKNDPRPCATLKQVFLDRFGLVVAHFGPPKIPKCLENGLFWDQKWVKNGSKTHFSKPHPRPFWGAQTGEMSPFRAHCEAFWPLTVLIFTHFARPACCLLLLLLNLVGPP